MLRDLPAPGKRLFSLCRRAVAIRCFSPLPSFGGEGGRITCSFFADRCSHLARHFLHAQDGERTSLEIELLTAAQDRLSRHHSGGRLLPFPWHQGPHG